jgi:spore maturation protein CgeB
MRRGLTIAFFGSSLVSAYWNGAATYYRGIIRALHDDGHRITFYEPDAYDRQAHRDIPDPPWARVVVYPGTSEEAVYSYYWPGLDTLFTLGKEILVADAPEKAMHYLRELPESDREALGRRAQARVLREHTAAHRAT